MNSFEQEISFIALRHPAAGAVNLTKRRRWFTDPPADPESGKEGTPPENKGGKPDEEKPTLTQAQADRLIGDARADGRKKATEALLKELGFEKPEDLKAAVTKAKEAEDANKTELQKAQDEKTALEKKNAELEQKLTEQTEGRRTDKLNTAVTTAAVEAKAVKTSDVLRWAQADAPDLLKAVLTDDGEVDKKAVETLIAKAKKDNPHYFGSGASGGKSPGSPSNNDSKGTTDQQKEAAKGRQAAATRNRW